MEVVAVVVVSAAVSAVLAYRTLRVFGPAPTRPEQDWCHQPIKPPRNTP